MVLTTAARSDEEKPTDPRVDRSRAAALEGALAVLHEEGWEAVTHLRVAERSGVGRTTLYRHWPERSALLRDMLGQYVVHDHELTGDLRTDLVEAVDGIRVRLADDDTYRVLATVFERTACASNDDYGTIQRQTTGQQMRPLRHLLESAAAAGTLRADLDIDEGVIALVAAIVYRRLATDRPTTRSLVETSVDQFLELHKATRST